MEQISAVQSVALWNRVAAQRVPLSGHQPFPFDVTGLLFNVVVVWHSPCGGDIRREIEIANAEPEDWERASKWVHGLMNGIGNHWRNPKWVDAYIEPASYPRPWTPQLYAAYRREQAREILADLDASAKTGVMEPEYVKEKLANIGEVMGWPTMRGGDETFIGGTP